MKSICAILILCVTILQSVSEAIPSDPLYEGETWVAPDNPIRIVCKIPMQEPFALEWTINNEPLNMSMSSEIGYNIVDDFLESESALLSVLSVRRAQTVHAGFYRCNKFSSHGHSIHILDSDASDDVENVMFKVGQSELILNCSLRTDQVEWYKNETKLNHTDGAVEIISEDGYSLLKIYKPKVGDLGEYSCVPKGEAKSVQKANTRVAMEPVVAEFTKSASVVEGDKLRQPCNVYGYPTPAVQWKKEKSEGEWEDLVADTHYEFDSHEGVPSATLVINEATNDDHAKYMCYAENELGSANRTVLVRVIDKYAAVWPFVGICIEVVVLCAVILIFERRRTKKMLEDTDNDQQRNSKHVSNAKDSEVRNRK